MLTSYIYWDPIVIDSTESEYYEWFDIFHINQILNLVVLLIYMGTMLTGILSKIPRVTTLMLINMTKIITLQMTAVFSMDITFRLMSTIFSHIDVFKYQNVNFNLNNVTTIHSTP